MYVRHSAWLAAEIRQEDEPAQPGTLATQEPKKRLTRAGILEQRGTCIAMPPLLAGMHILNYLWTAWPVESGGMGPAPLSASELRAWQQGSGVVLQPWEFNLIRRLSMDYLAESQQAEDPRRPAPWDELPELAAMPNLITAMRMKQSLKKIFE